MCVNSVCKWLVLIGLFAYSGVSFQAIAQNIPPIQFPDPVTPTPLQPQTPQTPLLPPDELLQISPSAPISPEQNPGTGTITVENFDFVGNTEAIFSVERLRQEIQEFTNTPITFAQLLQAASKITALYIKEGYVTSGAYIPEQTLTSGVVKIQIVEGSLQEIRIAKQPTSSRRLQDSYVRKRLNLATAKPLNVRRLQEALQLLQLDPLIKRVSAELSAGTTPGTNLLTVKIEEADSFSTRIITDNSRNPSVGSFRRGLEIEEANLTELGDNLNIVYDNTDGSNAIDASYTIPINPRNGTISFSYSNTQSNIIEPPFNDLDIKSNSRNYEITLRQPLVRNANQKFFQELAIGLTLSRRESNSSVSGVDFPIFLGADSRGNTRISALRFFQEWTKSSAQQVLFARSQFSLGVGAFDATINDKPPDSRFFTWRGQLFWLRLLDSQTSNQRVAPKLLLRSDVQLASRALVPFEQFTLGGIFSVRGYRQDVLFSDNGVFVSADLQLPIYSTDNGQNVLQLIPFVDIGTTWNSSGRNAPDPNTLASIGLGLQWQMGERFKARIDYGIPLVNIESRERTWQEKGLYFSLQYTPF
ncbi:ShlB/FhaC/HecB family hemolysin secretion/activation protein [Iningainema tapete]|uniref:ShlB/FhaC/HecB family hemolysin secretion/activation protein n=1 Tax=Iningainema tapete BLCC-T55 TaxID=2748662 RepID=A0A8J6XGX7_9CYAN|nr:ShlB/FhaC/HecB family hemolysin secretion/activation protein [Iningainema tapete]MBD2776600.1 ShlB/FhaC/HecB family hemolysin secretion/activation protein [Iningainema tapete BLCC-T55]